MSLQISTTSAPTMKCILVLLALAVLLSAAAAAPDHEPGHVAKGTQLDQQRHAADCKGHAHQHDHAHSHDHAHQD
ncbi:zinc import ATP-binding protein ZnuC-like [Bacillus rossius redtenbacheri]|uniref:zinc import ATP-binding protein ZnuC-like n=1 Tax=Bacillus rossius redtenbacheri TaxID=93214 RepID=UPI002FDD77F2